MAQISDSIEINLVDANEMINNYLGLNDNVEKKFKKNNLKPKEQKDVETFIESSKFNGFVFDIDSINTLLASGTTHLAIVLGAHHEDKIIPATPTNPERNLKKHEMTLVSIGCKEVLGKLFVNDRLANPATEWAPKDTILKIEKYDPSKKLEDQGGAKPNNFTSIISI